MLKLILNLIICIGNYIQDRKAAREACDNMKFVSEYFNSSLPAAQEILQNMSFADYSEIITLYLESHETRK